MSRYFLHHALLPLVAEVLILNTEFTPWWVSHWLVDIIPQGSGAPELCLLFPSFIPVSYVTHGGKNAIRLY